ncbi:hypothetical protein ARMGADRAFT_1063100 [Armillaria gallica]|uniref:Uncharacterized protein n=1 Tax=Armillaria gallica TaxID=47427 RepID=A0A2H3DUT1_ARMGA|nr:hypothetical protein ARMGADRAFT_1063100 [Armillaria gallica]
MWFFVYGQLSVVISDSGVCQPLLRRLLRGKDGYLREIQHLTEFTDEEIRAREDDGFQELVDCTFTRPAGLNWSGFPLKR